MRTRLCKSRTVHTAFRCAQAAKKIQTEVNLLQKKKIRKSQPAFGTFASPYTQADASACKRAKFFAFALVVNYYF
jgi:hypothetical protein